MNTLANYFDYAAATPLLLKVQQAMRSYLGEAFYNPSALYLAARQNRLALEAARHTIARGLGAKSTEIIFTAGGTEANNLAIQGVMQAYPQSKLLISAVEHESVLAPAKLFNCDILPVNEKGLIILTALQKTITDDVVLISIMYANNEVGTIQPISEIAQIVREINQNRQSRGLKLPLYLHSDACQAANYLDMQISRLGVDLLTINAGKIYGPKQCGALYVKSTVKLQPQILGGGQENGWRSGTQNLANIIGFAAAWEIIRQDYRQEAGRLQKLRDAFITDIQRQIPGVIINGPTGQNRLANNISLTFVGVDNERLVMALDELGFQVATGSACSAANDEPSHTLKAMGKNVTTIQNTIRITLGRNTNQASLKALAKALIKIARNN